MQVLGSAIYFPTTEDVKRLAVHDEDARRPIGAILSAAAEGADVNPRRTTMDRVRPRVARFIEHFLGLDDLVNFRLCGGGLRIYDINARGAEPWDDQVAPLEKRVARERRQCRRAGIPAEMMELVALVRHRQRVDDLAKLGRTGLHVDHGERVGFRKVRAK